jgi:hypothetical protein
MVGFYMNIRSNKTPACATGRKQASRSYQEGHHMQAFARASKAVTLPLVLACAACTQVPELDNQIAPDVQHADYPALVPLHQALAPLPDPTERAQALEDELTARRDRLRGRARSLNRAGVDDETKQRMQQGVSQ